MERLATEFYDFLENDEKMKLNTLLSYKRDIKNFYYHVNDFSTSINLLPNYFESYMNKLKELGKSPLTISRNIASLRKFFKFMISRQIICIDPTCEYKYQKKMKNEKSEDILTLSEKNVIISAIPATNFIGYRDIAILEILYACGLKSNELLNIRLQDLHLTEGYINVVSSDNTRYVRLYEDTIIVINKYIKKGRKLHKSVNSDILFLNKSGEPLSRQVLQMIFKKYEEKANINRNISPHLFRKSMAMRLIANGTNLRELQKILGHKSLSQTKCMVSGSR